MRQVYLIRHAKSSWDNPMLRDVERPLNQRGTEIAPKMAKHLWNEGIKPDLMMSSPARRALDTARFFSHQFEFPEDKFIVEKEIYEAAPMTILRIISNLPESVQTVFLFGHNPTFTEVANVFAGENVIENIPTCGIVCIESSAAQWNSLYEGNAKVTQKWFPKLVL